MTGFWTFSSILPVTTFSAIFKQDSKRLVDFWRGTEEARLLAWSQMISEFWFESGNKSKLTLSRRLLMVGAEGKSEEIPDIVEFTRQRLGFDPNPLLPKKLRSEACCSAAAKSHRLPMSITSYSFQVAFH